VCTVSSAVEPRRPIVPPPPKRRLSREAVLAAARAIVERDGLGAVSLRRVAKECGVLPNALYTYVRDVDDLLDGVVDDVLGDVRAPRRGGQRWDVALRRLLRAQRDLLAEHPALGALLLQRPASGPNAAALDARLRELLGEGGMTGAEAALAVRSLRAFVVGFAASEAGSPDPAGFEVGLRWLVGGIERGRALRQRVDPVGAARRG
jgi:TetR/AcrR family transcriptional regulator, tetracycline repressor protein